MSTIKEIGQVCRLILLFEETIASVREAFFHSEFITDDSLWSFFIGKQHLNLSAENIYNFMHKHGHPVSKASIELLCYRNSSYRNGLLTKNDFWQIFKPQTLAHFQSIIECRKKKQFPSKSVALNYKTVDLMIEIIEKTIQCEQFLEKMRENMTHLPQSFNLPKITPVHLQIYLQPYAKQFILEDAKRILGYILKGRKNEKKTFYSFFLPQKMPLSVINPNQKLNGENLEENDNWEGMKFAEDKEKIYKYGYKKKKTPLYLQ